MAVQEKKNVQVCLEKSSVWLMEHFAVYSLFAQAEEGEQVRFQMQVVMEGESATLFLGNRLDFAIHIFRRMVQGSVPPCTLEEVFSDMMQTALLERQDLFEQEKSL